VPKRPSSDKVAKVLRRHGFALVGQKGSHAKFRRAGGPTRTVIVPMGRKNLQVGTFHSILEQAGLSEDDF
jgi:predicted RNA binding protein YcfA (HicA-like mRNA interferase family)